MGHIISGKKRGHIRIDAEKIAHGIGVLGAIQAMQSVAARIRVSGGGLIDAGFQRRGEPFHLSGIGTRQVGRRHQSGADLANHLLCLIRSLFRMDQIEFGKGKAA